MSPKIEQGQAHTQIGEIGQYSNSQVLRDKRGNVRWKLPGNTPEENEQLCIRNIKALFLERFSKFNELFPRGEDGVIPAEKRQAATEFVHERVGSWKDFNTLFGKGGIRYETGKDFSSWATVLKKSFLPWGLNLEYRIVSSETGLYTGNGEDWAPPIFLVKKFGVSHNGLENQLKGVRTIEGIGRKSGKTTLYNLSEAEQIMVGIVKRPQVDKKTGTYIDDNNIRWVPLGHFQFQDGFRIDHRILIRYAEQIPSLQARGRNKLEITLFSEQHMLDLLEQNGYLDPNRPILRNRIMYREAAREETSPVLSLDENGESREIHPLNQTEGVVALRTYLRREKDFSDLSPFFVRGHNKENRWRVHIGEIESITHSKKGITINMPELVNEVLNLGGKVLAIPSEDEERRYQWLDFYLVDGGINLKNSLGSVRIDRENLAIESRNWHGVEIQLFLDYLKGKEDKKPSDLKEFKASANSSLLIYIGSIDGKPISTSFGDGQALEPGQEVIFRPKYDSELEYTWVEGFIVDNDGIEKQIFSRRFYKGEKRFYVWRGPEIQALVDWIIGTVPFEKVKPVKIEVESQRRHLRLFQLIESSIFIDMPLTNSHISQFDEVMLIPKKDELYEWIEVYKEEKEPHKLIEIASFKIRRENRDKLDGLWLGPARQRLIDFLAGNLNPLQLIPFELTVGTRSDIYLFVYEGRSQAIHLGTRNFAQGDTIIASPSTDQNGNLLLTVNKVGSDIVETYIFNREVKKFRNINANQKPTGYWTPEKLEREALEFYQSNGDLSFTSLSKSGKLDLYTGIVTKYSGGMPSLRAKLGILGNDSRDYLSISPEEANEQLRKLLKINE